MLWIKLFLVLLINSLAHCLREFTHPAAAKSLQSCPTLCDPIDGSPPGSPSLGFSRQEHWSGLPFPSPMHESEKWKWSRSVNVRLFMTPWTAAHQAPPSMRFSRQECWSGVPLASPYTPSVMSDSLQPCGLQPTRLLPPWDSPGENSGVGCHFLLQEIFPTQGSNPGLPHCREVL